MALLFPFNKIIAKVNIFQSNKFELGDKKTAKYSSVWLKEYCCEDADLWQFEAKKGHISSH